MYKRFKFNRCNNGNIYKKLNLSNINCDINKLNKLRLSYNNLPIDTMIDNKPTRFRRYGKIHINFENGYKMKCINDNIFKQDVDDFRNKPRIFEPIVEYDNSFLNLIKNISYLPKMDNINIKKMDIHIHQIRLISYPFISSDNSPEGIHRDGADYIVSALVLNKHNINNDKSIIYNENMEEIFNTNLNLGEFIFQEDRKLLHDITKINANEGFIGYRHIRF